MNVERSRIRMLAGAAALALSGTGFRSHVAAAPRPAITVYKDPT